MEASTQLHRARTEVPGSQTSLERSKGPLKCQAWEHLGVVSGNEFRKIGLNHVMKSIEC